MQVDQQPVFRIVSGSVAEVEAWIQDHWLDYMIQSFTYQVVKDDVRVTINAVLKSEAEKAMRMMQLAGAQPMAPGRRM